VEVSKAGLHVTVAYCTLASAQKLSGQFFNASAVSLDMADSAVRWSKP